MTINLAQKFEKPLKDLAEKCECITDIRLMTVHLEYGVPNILQLQIHGNDTMGRPITSSIYARIAAGETGVEYSTEVTSTAKSIKDAVKKLDKSGLFAPKRAKVLAVDFDGCLCENAWPNIGNPNKRVIEAVKQRKAEGWKIILWTCREDKLLTDALVWCGRQGLCFDAVNENLPERIKEYGHDPRKIGADEYWDDLAVTMPGGASCRR